jgi:hypothetical protein
MGCNGGLMDYAFEYLKKVKIEKEGDYTYTAKDGKCKVDQSKGVTGVKTYTDVPSNEVALGQALTQ